MVTCARCCYAEKFVSPDTLGKNIFKCRRFPPVPVASGGQLSFVFPLVQGTDVCGEYRHPLLAKDWVGLAPSGSETAGASSEPRGSL